MSNGRRATLHPIKSPMKLDKEKVEIAQKRSRIMDADKQPTTSRRISSRERKLALQQDVDKLKKKLKYEENLHRALERAFTRPLGTLPRLPAYLPPHTLELLAEVAVLEEEVVRLEEQVVLFRKDLYQEAVSTSSSSNKNMDCSKKDQDAMAGAEVTPSVSAMISSNEEEKGKENQRSVNSIKSELAPKSSPVQIHVKKRSVDNRRVHERYSPLKKQLDCRTKIPETAEVTTPVALTVSKSRENSPNIISEDIVKCLVTIFTRMRRVKSRSIEQLSSLSPLSATCDSQDIGLQDPYDICSEQRKRDIGPYKNLCSINANSIHPNRRANCLFLLRRLKILLERLASLELQGLTHQEKVAFWINVYNSCMMNAFLEQGFPESAETVVALMQKATINVGGHLLSAISIEHFILRLPYHSKYTLSKGVTHDISAQNISGLELSEPLVTFALSCGSWSSPAVRVYTASQVENELEVAKKDYLQAAIGISRDKKLMIPKLLDWYLLDFAKDLESLLDWICLQLPLEFRKEAIKCIERGKGEPLSQCVQVMPYDFSFRYLLHS